MTDNIFIRFGNWLARANLQDRITSLEGAVPRHTDAINKLAKENEELKAKLTKVEMYIGFRHPGGTKEEIKNTMDVWNRVQ